MYFGVTAWPQILVPLSSKSSWEQGGEQKFKECNHCLFKLSVEKPVLFFCKLTLFTGQRTLVLSDTQLEAITFCLPFTLNLPIERRM